MAQFIKTKNKRKQHKNQDILSGNREDFFMKGKNMKHKYKIIKLLTIIGSLILARTSKAQEMTSPKPGITVQAATEQDGKKNHTEITLKPQLEYKIGEYKVGYYGAFWCAKDSGEDIGKWVTTLNKVRVENEEWAVEIGKSGTREYASFLYTPTTTGFDNRGIGKGTSRTYSGSILTHKQTGLTIGYVSSDTKISPSHWDSALLGWKVEPNNRWALHLQMAIKRNEILSSGVTLKWQPTDNTSIVAEGLYRNKETTALLTANHRITDNLKLFAGAQITSPYRGKPDGLATMGASYQIGKGFTLVIAGQQKLGTDRATTALFGIKYSGNFRQ